jgi:hypothetical protein
MTNPSRIESITDKMFRVYSHYGCEILSLIKIDLDSEIDMKFQIITLVIFSTLLH